jgi:hypothetical protein
VFFKIFTVVTAFQQNLMRHEFLNKWPTSDFNKLNIYLFIFAGLGLELRAYTLSHSISRFL